MGNAVVLPELSFDCANYARCGIQGCSQLTACVVSGHIVVKKVRAKPARRGSRGTCVVNIQPIDSSHLLRSSRASARMRRRCEAAANFVRLTPAAAS